MDVKDIGFVAFFAKECPEVDPFSLAESWVQTRLHAAFSFLSFPSKILLTTKARVPASENQNKQHTRESQKSGFTFVVWQNMPTSTDKITLNLWSKG